MATASKVVTTSASFHTDNSKDVRLYAPLVISRNKQNGKAELWMCSQAHAYCTNDTPIRYLYTIPQMPNYTARRRNQIMWEQDKDTNTRLSAFVNSIKLKLQSYQERMLKEHCILVDISWDMLKVQLQALAYQTSSMPQRSH